MKMITAIINRKDVRNVSDALTEAGFMFTKISTSGGFLQTGNSTLMIGTEDDRTDEAIGIIRKNSARRMEPAPGIVHPVNAVNATVYATAEVPVGGATVFVTDVSYFEKM